MAANKTSDDYIRIQDFLGIIIGKWHWYLVSLLITLPIAVYYLLSTPPIYTRTASILLKNDSENGRTAGMSEFSELSIFRANVNINNELFTLKSPILMAEVVSRLGLNETYQTERGLLQVELYKSSPVSVTFIDDRQKAGISFNIHIVATDRVELSGFSENDQPITGKLGETLKTLAGDLVVSSTPHFSNDWQGKEIRYTRVNATSIAGSYAGRLSVGLNDENTTIINLSIADASIQKAEDILNTLIEVYNEKWIQDKNQISVGTSQFINDRLGVIESELGNVDDNISNFKSENLMPDIQAASSIYMTQSVENKRIQQELNVQLSTARYIRKELETKSINQTLPANSGIAGNNIEEQINEYNSTVLNRNRLIANSSERNPLVQDFAATLQSMKGTILQSVDNFIISLNAQLQSVQQQQTVTTGQLASNPNRAKYLLSVERQQKVKEELYLYLLQKREENELSQAFTAYNTRIMATPWGSNLPTFPRQNRVLIMAIAIGLLIPTVIIFLQETLNTKVRGRKDLSGLNIPLAGEIPYSPSSKKFWKRKKRGPFEENIVVKEENRNITNEAFRVLRSNIDFMTGKNPDGNVFILTSFNSGSGKSFLTVNIAISFAIKKKKILIIDGDLRHASLSAHAGSPKNGLSHYLGKVTDNWEELVVADKQYPNLHYIPVGTIPPNPTELLEDGPLAKVIEEVRHQYDYIFIDCPPIDIVADTQIIEKLTDRTFFVIRAGLLDRSMLSELQEIYRSKRFKNLAVILNGTVGNDGKYGYRYGYRYGHRSYYYQNS